MYILSTLWQDLCDKLWDICDHRREEVEGERGRIVEDQWLDDHIGLLSNHYITLMQVCIYVCMNMEITYVMLWMVGGLGWLEMQWL